MKSMVGSRTVASIGDQLNAATGIPETHTIEFCVNELVHPAAEVAVNVTS